jgi:hypothetical protein
MATEDGLIGAMSQTTQHAIAQVWGALKNISVGLGISLLCWRSGGVEHPHDTPPYPFMPSPTSAHSSIARRLLAPQLRCSGLDSSATRSLLPWHVVAFAYPSANQEAP